LATITNHTKENSFAAQILFNHFGNHKPERSKNMVNISIQIPLEAHALMQMLNPNTSISPEEKNRIIKLQNLRLTLRWTSKMRSAESAFLLRNKTWGHWFHEK